MFKKIFAVLTALMVLFAAAGCSEADKGTTISANRQNIFSPNGV